MPFYGIQKPRRVPVYREMKRSFPPATRRQYEAAVRALWRLPHREEKYAAIQYPRAFGSFIVLGSVPLYETLVRQGAWWHLVDETSVHLVGAVLKADRARMRPLIERWIDDKDMWIRRAALLSQIRHKEQTDPEQLFDHCLRLADEKGFFIRKAIGWALRDYSYTDPAAVRDFLISNKDRLSHLSFREGAKQLARAGLMDE